MEMDASTFTPGSYITKVPILGQAKCHHTYVFVENQSRQVSFPCGGSVDGVPCTEVYNDDDQLVSGPFFGDLQRALEIAKHDKNCGIIWGITGVCHQMANRIMWCCDGHPVIKAPGWEASYALYGRYGRGWNHK